MLVRVRSRSECDVTKSATFGRPLLVLAALLLSGVASPPPATAQLAIVLGEHLQARSALKVTSPRSLETQGTLEGLGLHGTFHTWREAGRERYDETLGIRAQRTLRAGGVEWVQNANGDVRELHGSAARRQISQDYIDSGDFARHPENAVLLGRVTLHDGREVWKIRVDPPGGEPYGVALDAATFMVDEVAYVDGDGVTTIDYSEYRVAHGALVPLVKVESSGERAYDITSHVTAVEVDPAIDPSVFAPLQPAVVDAAAPVTVSLLTDAGHYFVRGSVDGKAMLFLLDSGAQALFVDPVVAQRLNLTPEGSLEVRGTKRISGRGVIALDRIDLGNAHVPARVVSVVDLSTVTYNGKTVDGVLGYPFFAAAEVRIDPDSMTMTVAKPGTLAVRGTPLPIDTDRELPELSARLNGNTDGRFLIDTGNSNDLLVFHAFAQAHPGAVFYGTAQHFAKNGGVGGASAAVPAIVYRLEMGPYNLYNRFTDVMLSDSGAFADPSEAGNIGLGTLKNFVFTFDYANRALFLEKTRWFDDGRYRSSVHSSGSQANPYMPP